MEEEKSGLTFSPADTKIVSAVPVNKFMKIYSEKKKEKLNITLSVIIRQQNNSVFLNFIKEIQEQIIRYIPLNKRIQIYKYPIDTIHFSLMNFTSFELDVDFENARKIIELQEWYPGFLEYANEEIVKVPRTTFEFEKFFKKPDGSIKGSIALNIKNKDNYWRDVVLKKIEDETYRKLKELKIPVNDFGIKSHGDFFVVNLLRFFGEEDGFLGESFELEKLMEEKRDKFPELKVVYPIVVISDQYLSNNDPQIIPFILK